MSEQIFSNFALLTGIGIVMGTFVFLLTVWSVFWKGFGLWIAAKENSKPWFIVILILNTAGILELIYIFLVSKKGKQYITEWKENRNKKHHKPHSDHKTDTKKHIAHK